LIPEVVKMRKLAKRWSSLVLALVLLLALHPGGPQAEDG
jgi:hypothetical protein